MSEVSIGRANGIFAFELVHTTYAPPSLSLSSSFSTYPVAFFVLWGIISALLAGPLLAGLVKFNLGCSPDINGRTVILWYFLVLMLISVLQSVM